MNLPATFPVVARCPCLADYPLAVQNELREAGIPESALADLPRSSLHQRHGRQRGVLAWKIGCSLVFVITLYLIVLGVVKTVELLGRLF